MRCYGNEDYYLYGKIIMKIKSETSIIFIIINFALIISFFKDTFSIIFMIQAILSENSILFILLSCISCSLRVKCLWVSSFDYNTALSATW